MDIRLNYLERGADTPLILLHGNGESLEYFRSQIDFFSARYRVIALDTRGHGGSPRGEAPFTIAQFAGDLLEFMDSMRLSGAHILGFSDGGNIALSFALKHPERVKRLILNGANLDPSGVKRSVQLPIELGYALARPFAGRSVKARRRAELLGLMVNEPRISPQQLEHLTMPVLVIAGERDMIRADHTRRIAEALPDARLVFIPGDHFIAAKNPDAFNAAVLHFLEEDTNGRKPG